MGVFPTSSSVYTPREKGERRVAANHSWMLVLWNVKLLRVRSQQAARGKAPSLSFGQLASRKPIQPDGDPNRFGKL